MRKGIVLAVSIVFIAGLVSCGGGKSTKKSDTATKTNEMRGTAEGWAKVYDDDVALAMDRAVDDAKKKLVEKMLGATVSGRSLMQNYRLVSKIVETKSFGLVKDMEILKKGQEGTVYTVLIEGTVEPAAVDDAIQAALENYGRPKFMVLVKENFEGKNNLPGFTETEIIMQEVMGNSGFEFVDASMTQALMRKERRNMRNAMDGQVNQEVQQLLLNDAGAEVIIIGTAQTRDQSGALRSYGAANMKSKSAIVRIKAIDVYTGKLLATISRNAPGLHIESDTASKKAIENVMKQILGKTDRATGKFNTGPFINTIVKKFVGAATNRQINITIAGLNFKDLEKFRNEVKHRIRGVNSIEVKGQVGRASKLELYFAGKTGDFIYELDKKAPKLGFSVNVKERYPNKIVLQVKPL